MNCQFARCHRWLTLQKTAARNNGPLPTSRNGRIAPFSYIYRHDGSVGHANYWLVIPMVFCENRNVDVLREALVSDLGYDKKHTTGAQTQQLIQLYQTVKSVDAEYSEADLITQPRKATSQRLFPNVDGVKFLTHEGGLAASGKMLKPFADCWGRVYYTPQCRRCDRHRVWGVKMPRGIHVAS